jgi:hypothetical protein
MDGYSTQDLDKTVTNSNMSKETELLEVKKYPLYVSSRADGR